MYNWLVFLHVFFALIFMLVHGVHAAAMLAFRSEKDPERAMTFFNIVPNIRSVRWLMVAMGIPGIAASILTGWWRQGWVWASAVIFLAISFIMYRYGAGYFNLIQHAALGLIAARKENANGEAALQKFEAARTAPHPVAVSIVGIVGLGIIVWLMRFRPF